MTMERILKQNDSRITLFILYEVQPAKKSLAHAKLLPMGIGIKNKYYGKEKTRQYDVDNVLIAPDDYTINS